MANTCVDTVLEKLECLEKLGFRSRVEDEALTLKTELKFLRTFLFGSLKWKISGINTGNVEAAMVEAEKQLSVFMSGSLKEDLSDMILDLLKRVEDFKLEIGESYLVWSKCLLRPNSSVGGQDVLEFIESVLQNIMDLMSLKEILIISLKEQLLALETKLRFLKKFVAFAVEQQAVYQRIGNFLSGIGEVVENAAIFTYFCWLKKVDATEEDASDLLHDLVDKIDPYKPQLLDMYIGILKTSAISGSDICLAGEVVCGFVHFLLGDFLVPMNDQIEEILDGLILLMGCLTDPPQRHHWHGKLVSSHTEMAISDVTSLIASFCRGKRKDCIHRENDEVLSDIHKNISTFRGMLKGMVPEIVDLPKSILSDYKGGGSIDGFLSELRELLRSKPGPVSFVKHQLEIILRAVENFRSFLINNEAEQQDEVEEEVMCIWSSISAVVHEVAYTVSCFMLMPHPVWHYLSLFSDIIGSCKSINAKVYRHEHSDHPVAKESARTSNPESPQVVSSAVDELVVGLPDESKVIREKLTRGTKKLDIVAIVGMPGLGKTTLARKLYDEPSVTYHFHVRAWSRISQTYDRRVLVLGILGQVLELTDEILIKNDDDLIEQLRKCLKGKRYLIVMDDMWDTRAWDDLRNSFPDDKNSSRILFTSRLHEVALQVKPDCNPHSLRLFSKEESWELLEKRLFQKEQCPKELLDLGRQIAAGCQGLPLSVVLVAGILARTEKTVCCWNQVAKSVSSKLVGETEQCMEILEWSYKNLPDQLKACFLYFGSFPEDDEIVVRKLVKLWVAEGLVSGQELKNLEDIAEDYLMDLISRSLVTVSRRSSRGRVKTCQVHDLLHEFCKAKAKQKHFLKLIYDDDIKEPTLSDMITELEGHCLVNYVTYEVRWMSVFARWERFSSNMPYGTHVRSLMFFSTYNANQYGHSSFGSPVSEIFHNYERLRILDLGRINVGDSFPSRVQNLAQLTFLSLCGRFDFIPSSITTLGNLETLMVKGLKGEVILPETIWKMERLTTLQIDNRFVFREGDSHQWETSPSNLLTCSTLSLSHSIQNILSRLANVRRVKLICFDSFCFSDLEMLNMLESLKLLFYGQNILTSAFCFPSTLRKLTLSKFCLPWDKISTTGKLPNLEVLKLLHRAFEGEQWDMDDGEFLKLKFLKLDGLNFVQWNASSDHLPVLEQLVVHRCKQLQEIPSSFGDIPTLQKIDLQWCNVSASNSAMEIKTEQLENGNDFLKVLIHADSSLAP
ncbi:OLC1v1004995C1 [Oldenlandia corymbosa var. corymbosa]|uniref:OLC1v1004995C1 n=1 Tax=Oldenlandia corymbosa var. corymbosa TaxID=529605 RepID=A0AAV1DGB7_OLDCO|nr:OLC1v1004995C1 [Oldenlandia corymbosa var. corymbosa]